MKNHKKLGQLSKEIPRKENRIWVPKIGGKSGGKTIEVSSLKEDRTSLSFIHKLLVT